ncbi:MAG TPA: matrixin family metalloprotease, partial [Arthrobacter sp.]
VSFDPCRTIHYVMRRTGMPPGGQLIVTESMRRLSRATGLVLRYDGDTEEAPSAERPATNKALYGDRWAPILIAWSDPAETPELGGDVAGLGGGVGVSAGGGPEVYVSGSLTLDAPQLAGMLKLASGPELVRAVVMHELGHVVGLGHIDDPTQLMAPDLTPKVTDYADGDLTGLAILGRGPCAPGL